MADGLLNKASIILTPTGYKAGTLYNVAPVVEPYEDFDFARASVASRVNSSGLVEMVGRTLGSELVTNGDFANWTDDNPDNYLVLNEDANNYVTESNGKLRMVSNNSATIAIRPQPTTMLTPGNTYRVSVDLTFTTGTLNISGVEFNTDGTKVFYLTAPSTYLQLAKGSALDVLIDNVSVKEIIDTNNIPRINYDSNGENGHWLLEPTSTNFVTYSEDFSQWSNTDITFGTDGVSPSGVTNANLIQTGTAGNDQVSKAFALSATNTTTYSVFIKRVGGAEWIDFLIVKSGFLNSLKVWFNINNGTVGGNNANGTTTLDSASIEDYGNDWYRLIVTTTDSTNNTSFNIRVRTASADGSDTRVDNSSYYLWGMQLEALSYATSYIPTLTGSTVTRATETATGAGSADLINSTEGVLYAEIAALDDGTTQQIGVYGNSTSKQLRLEIANSVIRAQLFNGAYQANMSSTQTVTNFNKIAFKWKVNDFALWINGIEVATDSSGSTFPANDLDRLNLSGQNGLSSLAQAKIKSLAVFNEALSDDELNNLTG